MKQCKLIMVTEDNHNKFYDMVLNNGTIEVTYGRVGIGNPQKCTYPERDWNKKYNEKVRKGYVDITSYKSEVKISNVKEIADKTVKEFVEFLISSSKQQVANNYLISYKDVTQKQLDEAQQVIDKISKCKDLNELNNLLLDLFKIIPRKMKQVKEHLFESIEQEKLEKVLRDEQELLDNMAVQFNQNNSETAEESNDKTILELAGLEIEEADAQGIELCKKMLGQNRNQFSKAFKVVNKENSNGFKNHLEKADNKKVEYFWHGSRTENWWSILSTGLKIRPSNAVYTGSMFGDGLYFADKAKKSINYTSLSGSYWAKGNARKGYMTLYEVHVGKQKILKHHTSECYNFNKNNINADSVFAQGGADLINNEYIIYDSNQCKPIYIVEITNG